MKTSKRLSTCSGKSAYMRNFTGTFAREKKILYLNSKNVLKPKGLKRITDFLNEDKNNYKE